MILTQLLDAEVLQRLNQKQLNIVMGQLVTEIAASDEIKEILRKKAAQVAGRMLKK